MFSDSANIRVKRLFARDWRRRIYHRLLFVGLAVSKVEGIQKFRYRNPFFLTDKNTFDSFFKTWRAHEVSLRVR